MQNPDVWLQTHEKYAATTWRRTMAQVSKPVPLMVKHLKEVQR